MASAPSNGDNVVTLEEEMDVDLVVLVEESPNDGTKKKQRANKRPLSSVWNHFNHDKKNGKAICLCDQAHVLSDGSTTSLRYHIEKVQKDKADKPPFDQLTVDQMFSPTNRPSLLQSRESELTEAITAFIAKDGLPRNFVSGDGFKEMIAKFEPRLSVPHRTTFTRTHLPNMYEELVVVIKADIHKAVYRCFSTDIWVDDHRRLYYLAVTCHYVTDDWILKSYVLATRHFPERHTAANISSSLKKVLAEWSLSLQRSSWVSDNGANVLAALNLMKVHHFSGAGLNLNLCIVANGFEKVAAVTALLNKCKALVMHFRFKKAEVEAMQKKHLAKAKEEWKKRMLEASAAGSGDQRERDYEEPDWDTSGILLEDHDYAELLDDRSCQSEEGSVGQPQKAQSLKLSNSTRWNTFCMLLGSVIDKFRVCDELLFGTNYQHLLLARREKEAVKELHEFLKPFKAATDALQGEHYPSLSLIAPAVDELIQVCNDPGPLHTSNQWDDDGQLPNEDASPQQDATSSAPSDAVGDMGLPMNDPRNVPNDFGISELKGKIKEAFQRRFPMDKLFRLATSLDYRLKGDPTVYTTLLEYLEAIDHFCEVLQVSYEPPSFTDEQASAVSTPPSPGEKKKEAKKNTGFSAFFGQHHAKRAQPESNAGECSISSEINSYLALATPTKEESEKLDILQWWKEHSPTFPRLSRIARILFCLMATSAPSERVFSSAGNKVTAKRSLISPELVDMLVFLQGNFKYLNRGKKTTRKSAKK